MKNETTTSDSAISTLDVLLAARKKIENPANWLNRCPSRDEEARGQFCAARALWTSSGDEDCYGAAEGDAYGKLSAASGERHLPDFNDKHTHAEVLALFDKVIEAERAKATGGRETDAETQPGTAGA